MLGKLIKYDLKSINRYLIIIHTFLILASVFIRVFLTGHLFSEKTDFNSDKVILSLVLFITLYTLLITAIGFATQLVIAVRFYKNLFSDEGYLTLTLPVTVGEHLLSKTISGCIWSALNMVLLHISFLIVMATPFTIGFLADNKVRLLTEFGFTGNAEAFSLRYFLVLYIMVCLAGVISNIILFYASIAIGQLIYSHKVLGAIAAYFVLTTVLSLVMLIILMVSGHFVAMVSPSDSFNMAASMGDTLKMNCLFAVIQTVLLYPATYCIMRKKINLD